MNFFTRVATFAAIAAASACLNAEQTTGPLPAGGHHVLFVGNSLTYVNDLPATVAAIGASVCDTIRVRMDAEPNLALIDHLNGGSNAVADIRQGGWELVVLSQGPTPAGLCRDSLILWTKMFDSLVRPGGARTALFMTWPTIDGAGTFDAVRVSFQQAAASVSGVFMPAGEAWRSALRSDASLALWGSDGFHPSSIGTFLAALEIYERITGKDARALPLLAYSNGQRFSLPDATIRLLHDAAHDANSRFRADAADAPPVDTSPKPAVGHC